MSLFELFRGKDNGPKYNSKRQTNLAKLMRAFCPPLSTTPLSPTKVESPLGKSSKSYNARSKGMLPATVREL